MYHNDTNKMAAHVKRDAVRDYFVVNVADGSCRVFRLYEVIISGAVTLCLILHYWCLYRYQQYVLLSIDILLYWHFTISEH